MVAFSLVFWYLVGLCMCCGCVRADCCDVGSIGCSCIGVGGFVAVDVGNLGALRVCCNYLVDLG